MGKKELLQKYLKEANDFLGKNLTADDSKFKAWNHSLIRFLEAEFGKDSTTTKLFSDRVYTLLVFYETSHSEYVEAFEDSLKTSIEDLKRLIDEIDNENFRITNNAKKNQNEPQLAVNIVNNNSNVINQIVILTNEEIIEKIEDNTFLDDESKKELISELNKIEEIKNSSDSKSNKWKKAKCILSFIIDKGADIAIMFIPKILEAISK